MLRCILCSLSKRFIRCLRRCVHLIKLSILNRPNEITVNYFIGLWTVSIILSYFRPWSNNRTWCIRLCIILLNSIKLSFSNTELFNLFLFLFLINCSSVNNIWIYNLYYWRLNLSSYWHTCLFDYSTWFSDKTVFDDLSDILVFLLTWKTILP